MNRHSKYKFQRIFGLLIISFTLFSVSCRTTRYVPDGQYLLEENKIIFTKDASDTAFNLSILPATGVTEEDLLPIIKQQPNRRIFLLGRFYLWLYNRSNPYRIDRKIEKKIEKAEHKNERIEKRNTRKSERNPEYEPKQLLDPYTDRKRTIGENLRSAGEAPVILDSVKTQRSTKQIKLYLLNKGYFTNQVKDSIVYIGDTIEKPNGKLKSPKKKNLKKAVVYYVVTPHEPYKVRNYTNDIKENAVYGIINQKFTAPGGLIRKNENFDTDKLEAERKQVTKLLLESGYYYFNKEFVFFKVDSSLNSHEVDISLGIQNYKYKVQGSDSLLSRPHKAYHIDQITIYADYRSKEDTSKISHTIFKDIIVAHNRSLKIKPAVMYNAILFKEGELYQKSLEEATYKRINALGTYKAVSIQYYQLPGDKLGVNIYLTPAKAQTFTIASDGTQTNGLFGIEGSMTYTHNNMFGGAEKLQISMTGGIEMQRLIFSGDTTSIGLEGTNLENLSKTFNTIEFGPKISLTLPRFLFIQHSMENWFKLPISNPKTEFSASLNFQNRPDFRRSIEDFKFTWIYHEKPSFTLRITPFEISAIEIEKSAEFQQRIDDLNDKFLAASYQDHIIAGGIITGTYNGQILKKKKPSTFYFQGSLEGAGNVLRAFKNISGATFDDPTNESYDLFNIRFAQFVKISGDFRHYYKLGENGKVVSRLAGGIGIPGKNLKEALPFEKSFFSGGTNGLRAWKARTLGPGGYLDPDIRFDKIGDIQLEGNLELRFPIISWVEGALFLDAGNIWLINADSLRIGGKFETNDFITEIAIGSGFGVRFDLDFFVIRLDLAIPIKNPSQPLGERWIWEAGLTEERRTFYRPQLNLGIGYPF
ncbi:MAG: outer membrane protein assembly factor BamA [Parvicella sp.]